MITACAALPTRISAHGSPQPPICGTVETNPKRLAPKSHALAAGVSPFTAAASWAKPSTCGIMTFLGCIPDLPLNLSCRRFQKSSSHFTKKTRGKGLSLSGSPRYVVAGVWSGKAKVVDRKIQFLPRASADLHKHDNTDANVFIEILKVKIKSLLPKN